MGSDNKDRTQDKMAGIGEIFGSFSGWLKLLELIFSFITLIIHRHGDFGNYLFFATTALKLSNTDSNIDMENLGNSTLVTFTVISCLIIGYVIDGREYVQGSILEPVWNLVGTFMFMVTGVCAIMTWSKEERIKTSGATSLSETEYNRNVDGGLAMGAMCIIIALIYAVDTLWSFIVRKRILRDEKA